MTPTKPGFIHIAFILTSGDAELVFHLTVTNSTGIHIPTASP
jgi:hypothetical protein